jgi:hypothetical protein
MTKLPTLRTAFGQSIGTELFFSFPELQEEQRTFLDADSATGATTLTANGINFADTQYIVIGQPGALKTEIVKISGTPTATSITVGATSFPHSRGDIIRFIPYNQIVAEWSSDGTTFTPISAINIRSDSSETYLSQPADLSTYSYKFRLYNSTGNTYSQYSAIIPATGYADNTIGSVKRRALREMGEVLGDLVTDNDLNDWLQQARRQMDQMPQVLRWTFRQKFNTIIGQCIPGAYSVAAPTDLRDRNTFKNILGLRFGRQNRPCVYQDAVRFAQNYLNVAHSTLNGAVVFGATSVILTSSHDFDDSGSITIAAGAVGGTRTILSYTGNNRSTNTLTGVTGVPVAGLLTGLDSWQNANFFGLPTAYTIDSGLIRFDVPFYDALDGRNIVMDYYTTIPSITTDAGEFDEPFWDMYVSFLKWKIAYKKANGKIDRDSNSDYKDWMEGVGKVIAQETNGQKVHFIPDIEGFLSSTQ